MPIQTKNTVKDESVEVQKGWLYTDFELSKGLQDFSEDHKLVKSG